MFKYIMKFSLFTFLFAAVNCFAMHQSQHIVPPQPTPLIGESTAAKDAAELASGSSSTSTSSYTAPMASVAALSNLTPAQTSSSSNEKMNTKKYPCNFIGCQSKFNTTSNRKVHVQRHHIELRSTDCKSCGQACETDDDLAKHNKEKHRFGNPNVRNKKIDRPYICDQHGCTKKYTTYNNLHNHLQKHHPGAIHAAAAAAASAELSDAESEEKNIQEDNDDEHTGTPKVSKERHLETAAAANKCPFCPKIIPDYYELDRHIGEDHHQQSASSSSSSSSSTVPMASFGTHAHSHAAPKSPNAASSSTEHSPAKKRKQCQHPGCEKWILKRLWTRHQNIHTESKKYPCNVIGCPRKFNQNSNRIIHIKQAHTLRSTDCTSCGQECETDDELAKHKKDEHKTGRPKNRKAKASDIEPKTATAAAAASAKVSDDESAEENSYEEDNDDEHSTDSSSARKKRRLETAAAAVAASSHSSTAGATTSSSSSSSSSSAGTTPRAVIAASTLLSLAQTSANLSASSSSSSSLSSASSSSNKSQ